MVSVVAAGAFMNGLICCAKRNSIRSNGASGDSTRPAMLCCGGRGHLSSGMRPQFPERNQQLLKSQHCERVIAPTSETGHENGLLVEKI